MENYSKGEKYHEHPVPDKMKNIADTLTFGMEADEPIVGVTGTSVYCWIRRAAERRQDETDDEVDWGTFRKHYLGEFSPEAINRERQKVDFLEGETDHGAADTSSMV